MKTSLWRRQIGGFLFTAVGGILLHYVYDWLPFPLVALIAAVNESIWEHMKLLYVPLALFALIGERRMVEEYPGYWCATWWGTLAGIATIPLLYYTYTGALGVSADWFNIFIYFVAAAVALGLETHLLCHDVPCRHPNAARWFLIGLWGVFILLTFAAPHLPLFQDPLSGGYGI